MKEYSNTTVRKERKRSMKVDLEYQVDMNLCR